MTNLRIQSQKPSSIANFSSEQVNVLKNSIAKGATDDELELFLYTCKRTGLDPFSRQIYLIQRWDNTLKRNVGAIQTSIDGFRAIASRDPDYAGQTTTLFCGKDGVWTEIWTNQEFPFAAKVGVYRKGYSEATFAIAKWNSYVQYFKDKNSGKQSISNMWQKFPELMLGKCAEALALRKAFPNNLSGLYTHDEMGQADNEIIETQITDEKPKHIIEAKQISLAQNNEQEIKKNQAPLTKNTEIKNENVIDIENSEEILYNGSDDHKTIFRSLMQELKHIPTKASSKITLKEVSAIYREFSDNCIDVPLKYLKEHLLNLEQNYISQQSKKTAA